MENQANESFETILLNPDKIDFTYQGENLTFTDHLGNHYPRVTLRRCFPLSSENTNIIVRLPEKEGENGLELGMISDVYDLDECSQEAVLRELRLHYVVPMIIRIKSIREEFGFLYWSTDTDRGEKDFIMRDSIIANTRQVSLGRWLIIDINQTRYEIHRIEDLDEHSQNLLHRFLLI